MERVCFLGLRELVCVGTRVTIKGARTRVIPGDVRIEGGRGSLGGGGAPAFALGCVGRGVGRVVTLAGGTGARVGACARGGGAANNLCDKSRREALMMEVWFPRREYAVRQAAQGHSYDRICRHENDPGQSLIGKLRCVRYPIYMTSVLQRSVMTMSCSHVEKGTQLRLDTVCGGPHSGLLPHNTSHRRVVWSIALLTPTSVP